MPYQIESTQCDEVLIVISLITILLLVMWMTDLCSIIDVFSWNATSLDISIGHAKANAQNYDGDISYHFTDYYVYIYISWRSPKNIRNKF